MTTPTTDAQPKRYSVLSQRLFDPEENMPSGQLAFVVLASDFDALKARLEERAGIADIFIAEQRERAEKAEAALSQQTARAERLEVAMNEILLGSLRDGNAYPPNQLRSTAKSALSSPPPTTQPHPTRGMTEAEADFIDAAIQCWITGGGERDDQDVLRLLDAVQAERTAGEGKAQ